MANGDHRVSQVSKLVGVGAWRHSARVLGKFAYTANYVSGAVSAFSIDATNGSLVPVGGAPFAAGAQPTSIAVSETLQ